MGPKLSSLEMLHRATAREGDTGAVPRTLMVFAHVDDETIALGARLHRFGSAHLVHVTDGAPKNEHDSRAHGFSSLADYRAARVAELGCVLQLAGVGAMSRECLGIPDQETSLQLVELARALAARIERHRPEVIFTHPYEGGHPDHDACAFGVRYAVEIARIRPEPLVVEAVFYHAGPHGIETAEFLAPPQPTGEVFYELSPAEQQTKAALIACFRSQQQTLQGFSLTHERFRIAPRYDFTTPPAAAVFYDRFPWGMTAQRFCELATLAEASLRQETGAACP